MRARRNCRKYEARSIILLDVKGSFDPACKGFDRTMGSMMGIFYL